MLPRVALATFPTDTDHAFFPITPRARNPEAT
jgi:hypothetical protein